MGFLSTYGPACSTIPVRRKGSSESMRVVVNALVGTLLERSFLFFCSVLTGLCLSHLPYSNCTLLHSTVLVLTLLHYFFFLFNAPGQLQNITYFPEKVQNNILLHEKVQNNIFPHTILQNKFKFQGGGHGFICYPPK